MRVKVAAEPQQVLQGRLGVTALCAQPRSAVRRGRRLHGNHPCTPGFQIPHLETSVRMGAEKRLQTSLSSQA